MHLCTGFHEAIGETIALSVASPRHLQTLGLVQKSIDDTAHDINYLFTQAMDKLAFLPFALVMDKWRWDVFTGDVRKEQYNCHWWRLRFVHWVYCWEQIRINSNNNLVNVVKIEKIRFLRYNLRCPHGNILAKSCDNLSNSKNLRWQT